MAASLIYQSAEINNFLEELEGSDHQTEPDFLEELENHQTEHTTFPLKNPAGAKWTTGNLQDTIYRNEENVVNGWNTFYLPEIVNMQVLGVVTGPSCPCDQLVLMTCENKKVYVYDGEELHLVALSMKQLKEEGINYPSDTAYYKGEAFKDMSNEDWDEVKKSPVGKELDKKHDELVKEKKSDFLKNLRSIRQNTGTCSPFKCF